MTLQTDIAERLRFFARAMDKGHGTSPRPPHASSTAPSHRSALNPWQRIPTTQLKSAPSSSLFYRWERLRNIRNALVRDYPEHSA